MIQELSVKKFKILDDLSLSDMKRITLVSGKNNVGKSTLLEAVFLYMNHTSTDSFYKINALRGSAGTKPEEIWSPLFSQPDSGEPIRIAVTDDNGEGELVYSKDSGYVPNKMTGITDDLLAQFRMSLNGSYSLAFAYDQGKYKENGHFSINENGILREINTSLQGNEIKPMIHTRFSNPLVTRNFNTLAEGVGNLELSGEKTRILRVLKQLDPDAEDIITVAVQGKIQLYLRVKGKMIPLQYAGDGVINLLNICLAILESRNGLVLIDEIEAGFHYSMYKKLWEILDRLTEEMNCQIIATTHSYELIAAVRENIASVNDFTYYRIGRNRKGLSAYRYDYSMLEKAIESELEIR